MFAHASPLSLEALAFLTCLETDLLLLSSIKAAHRQRFSMKKYAFSARAALRYQKNLNDAFIAGENGASFSTGAQIARMSASGFFYNYNRRGVSNSHANLSLTELSVDQDMEELEMDGN